VSRLPARSGMGAICQMSSRTSNERPSKRQLRPLREGCAAMFCREVSQPFHGQILNWEINRPIMKKGYGNKIQVWQLGNPVKICVRVVQLCVQVQIRPATFLLDVNYCVGDILEKCWRKCFACFSMASATNPAEGTCKWLVSGPHPRAKVPIWRTQAPQHPSPLVHWSERLVACPVS